MTMFIPVSVVVPAYNAEAQLKAALSSIARQTMREFECIIVDDCSTDNTRAVAKRFLKSDGRFRLVTHRAKAGVSASRNSGLRTARGEYIVFLDAEDMMTPESIEMRLDACRNSVTDDRRWAGAYCGIATTKESSDSASSEESVSAAGDFLPTAERTWPPNVGQPMTRRDVMVQAGGFNESLAQAAEDQGLWMRILRAGYWFAGVPKVGVVNDVREDGIRGGPGAEYISAPLVGAASPEQAPPAVAEAAKTGPLGIPVRAVQGAGVIYFFPHSGYHAWTIDLIAPALHAQGIPFVVVDISTQSGDGGLRQKLAELAPEAISYSRFVLERHRPGLVVVFNDWDHVTRPIIAAARVAGIPSLAVVEGIQDYNDVDTGRVRNAYKTADAIILPGEFDRRYFEGHSRQRIYVAGIPRVKHMRANPRPTVDEEAPIGLINSNFSYNVLTQHRDEWLRSAVAAVRAAGLEPVISRHPGDAGREHADLETRDDFYTALSKSVVTVQRFASGILEALAIGRGVVYFNPHGEKVDKFSDPLGAYEIASTQTELVLALRDWPQLIAKANERGPAFLDLHAGPMSAATDAAMVDALKAERAASTEEKAFELFHELLGYIDIATEALTTGKQLFPAVDQTSLEQEFARLKEAASSEIAAFRAPASAPSARGPTLRLPASLDTALRRLYRREKQRNSRLYRWSRRVIRFYRKITAPP